MNFNKYFNPLVKCYLKKNSMHTLEKIISETIKGTSNTFKNKDISRFY